MLHRSALALALALSAVACHKEGPVPGPQPPPGPTATTLAPDPSPAPTPPARKSFEIEDGRLVLPGPIVFVGGGAALDEEASADALEHVRAYLESHEEVTLMRIERHGDAAGEGALMQTGEQALVVGRWLVAHGIACERLLAAAFGDTKPVADPSTAEGRARNRRVEAVNAQLRGRSIGGMPDDGSAPAAAPVCD